MARVYDLLCVNCGQPAREHEKCDYCGYENKTNQGDDDDATESDPDDADDDSDATPLDERSGPD